MRNLSEVNVNTAVGRGSRKQEGREAGAQAVCSTITYISPPRHPSAALTAAQRTSRHAESAPDEYTTTHPALSRPRRGEAETGYAQVGRRDGAKCESGHESCGCATCARVRAESEYDATYTADGRSARTASWPVGYTAGYSCPHCLNESHGALLRMPGYDTVGCGVGVTPMWPAHVLTTATAHTRQALLQSLGEVPVMAVRTNTRPGSTRLGGDAAVSTTEAESGCETTTSGRSVDDTRIYATSRAVTEPECKVGYKATGKTRASVTPTEQLCVELMHGRIVELACTATGKSQLQAVLRSHPALVLDLCVREMCAAMDHVALDSHGCHVLRAVVELCDAAQMQQVVATLHEELIIGMCTASQYTRRVIQTLFERALVDLSFPVHVIARNGFYLAATQQGCISFMRVYEHCNREQQALLMQPLVCRLAELALDPLGNYVVQCAMEHSEKTAAAQFAVGCFAGRVLAMSCDKFASNVMEKVARCCGDVPAVRRLLMDELVYNPVSLQEAINDGYGNFVLQALIECVTQPMEFKRMCDRLKPVLPNSPFAAKIETKLKQRQRAIGSTEQLSFLHHTSNGHQTARNGGRQQQQQHRAQHQRGKNTSVAAL